jgi:hypothetical protein
VNRWNIPLGCVRIVALLILSASGSAGAPSHGCLLHAGRGTLALSQPGRQPARQGGGIKRPGRAVGDHGCDHLGRPGIHLPAVEGQELQHGRQRDLLVAAPQQPPAHQRVQQGGCRAGRVAAVAARLRLGQGVLGGGDIEQVEHLPSAQAERAAGDDDQVGDLQRDHG